MGPALAATGFANENPVGFLRVIRDLADAAEELGLEVEEARSERAAAVGEEQHDLATAVIVHQVESTAFDLLRGSGNAAEEAREALYV